MHTSAHTYPGQLKYAFSFAHPDMVSQILAFWEQHVDTIQQFFTLILYWFELKSTEIEGKRFCAICILQVFRVIESCVDIQD
jgi:hypothetical protein